jgi:hypothetical protein
MALINGWKPSFEKNQVEAFQNVSNPIQIERIIQQVHYKFQLSTIASSTQ